MKTYNFDGIDIDEALERARTWTPRTRALMSAWLDAAGLDAIPVEDTGEWDDECLMYLWQMYFKDINN